MPVRSAARAVALAALALASAASAQSSVTLFGVVDAGISYTDAKTKNVPGVGTVKQTQYGMSNSGYNSSRLGFRGTEDLGGGLAAGFWLEAPLGVDSGTISSGNFFNRRSTVSLSGGFGEIRLGRDYTPTFWNDSTFDPFGTNGVGTNIISVAHNVSGLDGNYARSSNSIGYFLPPNLGGFYGQVMYGFDEKTHQDKAFNSQQDRYAGGRFGWASGPLDVAIAYGQSKVVDRTDALAMPAAFNTDGVLTSSGSLAVSALDRTVKTINLGASYDFGVVKLFGELSQVRNESETAAGTTRPKINGWLFGATAPVGPGLIRASVSQARVSQDGADPRATKFALGYVHNLSKRTALYVTAAHTSNKDGSALTTNASNGLSGAGFATNAAGAPVGEAKGSNGYEFGIRHQF